MTIDFKLALAQLTELLNYQVVKVSGQAITLGDILFIPVLIFIGLLLTKWLTKFISKRLTKQNTDPNAIHLIQRIVYVLSITVIIISILDFMNVPIAAFAFLSGAIAIGFGFGAQNIINNFISGWILMWERPIRIGDFLEVESTKGLVEEINTRSTRIKRVDGVHLLIPNSKLLENTVVNWTLVDPYVRCSVTVGVAYGSPAKKVAELIMQATIEQEETLAHPKPVVTFDDFGDSALIFQVTFWISSQAESGLRVAKSKVRFRLDELFAEHKIVVAFPQRDIHLDGSLTINKN
ncbi:Mechanosensitive ion channel [Colwellia chukchiensis]|uniref:Mechanosensitive ion channel n=1 Tax=Colwellia chukchiensis TaxID=641665 RepID=A0A1H7NV48_9GAMM|nr:mechanosensitive ion channel domain-containing protein [Colwellia chukchiensis]SEL27403.1 Mechanosensitive ion channel [Colwellia chukchiensis]